MTRLQIKGLSPEKEFLISAVRSAISGDGPPIITASIDWAIVTDEALHHSVVPQLWRTLEQPGSVAVPPHDVRERLRVSFHDNVKRNLALTGELWRLIEMFKAEGITAISFKGPTLAILAYGSLAWREFADIDVLVDERDLVKVGELLESAGYQPQMDLSVLRDPVFLAIEREFYFTDIESGTLIDIQWRLSSNVGPFDLGMEHVAQHQITVRPGGKEFVTLRVEDLLLLLCVHGSRHCWSRLKWIADVAGLINLNPHLDWDLILEQSRALKCGRVLLHSLLLAHDLIGADIPVPIKRLARGDSGSRELAASVVQTLAQPHGWRMNKFNLHRYFLKLGDHPSDRLRHIIRMIFAPNVADWEFRRLPGSLTLLYVIIRPIRLITEFLSFSGRRHPTESAK